MEVSVIIVSMNNYEVLSRCLDSIRTHTSTSYEVFVVAYLFSPENLQHLRQNYPWAQIIESNEIRGFSANNNLALRKATGKYCFVLNDDTKIESDVITSLAATFDQLPSEAAVVSPKLLFADHSLQYCGRPEINWKTYVLAQLGLWREKTVESPYTNRIGIFRTYNLVRGGIYDQNRHIPANGIFRRILLFLSGRYRIVHRTEQTWLFLLRERIGRINSL